jgi:hypothetical protein
LGDSGPNRRETIMKTPNPAPGRHFYEEQIDLFQAAKTDELIDRHYYEDAVLVTFEKVVRGRTALKDYFRGYRAGLGDIAVLSLDQFVETGDTVFFEATVRTKWGDARVYDAFVLREGKATHHFAGKIAANPKTA